MLANAFRAARLDTDFYNTVERDTSYTPQAFGVVLVANGLAALGTWFWVRDSFVGIVVGGLIAAVIVWVVWAALAAFIGTRFFGGTADTGEMLRVLGFAQAPVALGIVPGIGALVGTIWMIIASVVAIREGLDFTTGKAIGTLIVGWIAFVIIRGIFFFIF